MYLENIKTSGDVKKLNIAELNALSKEIRELLIDTVSKNGGHLASNLGAVELTLAMHKVFDFPSDKVVFDVGHQCYVHKLLTGRQNDFLSLRKKDGLAGFPKIRESEFDFFNSGHSSNSLSVALGLKRGSLLKGEKNNVIAFIGDGSFGGGMVYEAINDISNDNLKDNIIIILNDNEMSISKNKSSISRYLEKLRLNSSYINVKDKLRESLSGIPVLERAAKGIKNIARKAVSGGEMFEGLGIKYYGPVDGHDLNELIRIFEGVKHINKPVLIHTVTKKGKGYPPAEANPEKFHGISPFDIKTGEVAGKKTDFSSVFGEALLKIAGSNDRVVAVTAAMPSGTGLCKFEKKYPERFFDVGICEEHGVSMCAGLALSGMIPVFAIYSSFLQRSYDQLITDICAMNLHAVFCIDRAGIVGADGETHQGIFDISYLNSIPGMTVLSPADFKELEAMLSYAVNEHKGPIAIRYPRGGEGAAVLDCPPVEYKKSVLLKKGEALTIVAEGKMVNTALGVADRLLKLGKSSDVINIRFIKPLDTDKIKSSVAKTGRLLVIEEGLKSGGLGESILSALSGMKFEFIGKGICDTFVEHGEYGELIKMLGLDEESIFEEVKEVFGF